MKSIGSLFLAHEELRSLDWTVTAYCADNDSTLSTNLEHLKITMEEHDFVSPDNIDRCRIPLLKSGGLRRLCLEDIDCQTVVLGRVHDYLTAHPKLTSLALVGCQIDGTHIVIICQTMEGLQDLNLRRNSGEDKLEKFNLKMQVLLSNFSNFF